MPGVTGFSPVKPLQLKFGALPSEIDARLKRMRAEEKAAAEALAAAEAEASIDEYKRYPVDSIDYNIETVMDPLADPHAIAEANMRLLDAVGDDPNAAYGLLQRFAKGVTAYGQCGLGEDEMDTDSRARLPKDLLGALIRVMDQAPDEEVREVFARAFKLNRQSSPSVSYFSPVFGPELDTAFLKMAFGKLGDVQPYRFNQHSYWRFSNLPAMPLNEKFLFAVLHHQVEQVAGDAELIADISGRLLDAVKAAPEGRLYDIEAINGDTPSQRAVSALGLLREQFKTSAPPRGLIETLVDIAETGAPNPPFGRIPAPQSTFPEDLELRYYGFFLGNAEHKGHTGIWLNLIDNLLQNHGQAVLAAKHPFNGIYRGTVDKLVALVEEEASHITPQERARNVLTDMQGGNYMRSVAPDSLVKRLVDIMDRPRDAVAAEEAVDLDEADEEESFDDLPRLESLKAYSRDEEERRQLELSKLPNPFMPRGETGVEELSDPERAPEEIERGSDDLLNRFDTLRNQRRALNEEERELTDEMGQFIKANEEAKAQTEPSKSRWWWLTPWRRG